MDFMANEKSIVEEAWPGDVVGLYDSGNFKIGDTLTEGEKLQFKGIPSFSPSIFKEVENMVSLRRNHTMERRNRRDTRR